MDRTVDRFKDRTAVQRTAGGAPAKILLAGVSRRRDQA
jgi:hypothetical protein